jgi:hypothetical protein
MSPLSRKYAIQPTSRVTPNPAKLDSMIANSQHDEQNGGRNAPARDFFRT